MIVSVRPLEWREKISDIWWTANAYRIERDGGGFSARVADPQSRVFRAIAFGVSFEAAKAAAQAHHEAAILSEIEPQAVDDAMVERAHRAYAALGLGAYGLSNEHMRAVLTAALQAAKEPSHG